MAGALTSLKELFIEVRLPSDEKRLMPSATSPTRGPARGEGQLTEARARSGSDVMRTLALGLLSVLLLLAVLLSLLLPATATAQGKEDLKAVRGDNSVSFHMGYITGLTNGYIAANLVTCPRPVNGVMVLGVLDSRDRPYDDRTPEAAVLHALVDLGCPADSAAASDVRPR